MGHDKALLRLDDRGPTLLESTAKCLARITGQVVVIAPEDRGYQQLGFEVISDVFPGGGPLGGIATGLIAGDGTDLLVVACDHPFLSGSLLEWMATLDGAFDAVAPKTHGESRQGGEQIVHTLHAIYRPSCLPVLEELITVGYRSSTDLFNRIRLRALSEAEMSARDPSLRSLLNVNTPEALEWARQIRRAEGNPTTRLDYTQQSS